MATIGVDKRIDELEARFSKQLSELGDKLDIVSQKLQEPPISEKEQWWSRVVGIYKNDAAFEEADRLSKAYRNSLDHDNIEADN